MADYSQLVNSGGTIFNQGAKVAYQNPDQLAADLGTTAGNIQWGQIAKAGADFNPMGYAGYAIPTTSLSPVPTIPPLPQPTLNTAGADSAVAGVTVANKTYQDYYNQANATPTPEQTQSSTLSKDLLSLIGQDTGKAQELATQEANLGLPDMQKQMGNYNADILRQVEEYNVLKKQYDAADQAIGQDPQQLSAVVGTKRQELQRTAAAELNVKAAETQLTQARALGLQGNIQAAQTAAQKAVDLKYAAVEDQIAVKKAQLAALDPILTKQEKAQAVALDRQYSEQQTALAEEKAKVKTNISLALDSGITSRFANKAGEIFDVNSGKAYSDATTFLKDAGVSSFEEAYAKGLVQDIKPSLTFTTETVNGRKVRMGFDAQGKLVSKVDLGSSTSGSGGGAPKTLSGAASTIKQAWQDQGYIQGNGKISSQDYKDAKAYWTAAPPNGLGYTVAQFDTQFGSMIDKSGSNWRQNYSYTGT